MLVIARSIFRLYFESKKFHQAKNKCNPNRYWRTRGYSIQRGITKLQLHQRKGAVMSDRLREVKEVSASRLVSTPPLRTELHRRCEAASSLRA